MNEEGYQIFASGYCQPKHISEEKKVQQYLEKNVPSQLHKSLVKFDNDLLTLIASTSAAERLFEHSNGNLILIFILRKTV